MRADAGRRGVSVMCGLARSEPLAEASPSGHYVRMAARESGRVSGSIVLGCAALVIAITALVVAGYTLIDDASCERPYDNDIRSDVCFERRGPCELHLERPRAGARCIRLAARTNHQEWLVHLAVRPVDISRCSTVHIADVERLLVSRRRPHVLTVGRQRADEEGDYQRRDLRAGADGRERLHRPVFRAPGLDPVLTAPELPISRTLATGGPDQNVRPYRAGSRGDAT